MKRIIYILAAALIGVCACNRNEFEPLKKEKAPESGKVAVILSVQPPVELTATTKANYLDSLPKIDYIKVAVFGTSGYPQEYTTAEPVNKTDRVDADGFPIYEPGEYAKTNGEKYYFKVLLPVYEGEAHVHIIANGDERIKYDGEDEYSIMSKMETADNVGAYWARVILEDGILADLTDDGIMRTDSDGNFIPSSQTAALFEDLVLVRNFAQVTLENHADNLYDVTWTLVNVPVSGSVAPMAPNDKGDYDFVSDYKNYTYNTTNGLMQYNGKTYAGYMTNSEIDTNIPAGSQITNPITAPQFMYERIDPNMTSPTAILMKARFGSATAAYTYYRLDLMAESMGGYFPLYRNYKYQISINRVGNKGSSTPEEAMLHESGSNVSMTAEAQTLTDISDGFSRLYVEYIEKTFTTGGTKTFWVYYVPDVQTGTIDNSSLEVKIKDAGTALASGATGDVLTPDTTDPNMYVYSFNLNGQDDDVDLSSVFQVKATNGSTDPTKVSTLYRDITVKVIKKMDMVLGLDPKNIGAGTDIYTTLSISLNSELPDSMFPLEFYIEDTNRTLNPTGKDGHGNSIDVPVKLGTSLADPTNTNSYFYIRTVNHDEYERIYNAAKAATPEGQPVVYSFDTEFKTIKDASATTIYVDNDYFNVQHIDLSNHPAFLSPSSQTVASNATSATVAINVATGEDWTATVDGGASFEPNSSGNSIAPKAVSGNTASGTGPATLTVYFAANNTGDEKTYKVTVTAGDIEEVSKIIQRRQAQTYSVSYTDFNINNRIGTIPNANDHVTIRLTNAASATNGITMGYRGNNRNNYGTITVSPVNGSIITGITVTYLNTQNAGWDSDASSTPSGYSTDNTSATGTWTGSSQTAVTITNSMTQSSGNQRNWPVITGITVTYE
ncbi:MAG: hypothetical protein IJL91_05015 [Bacteroidales bacterium]|nr:hypothetical protein [Bacteroidales bacterium]